jgi:hypothetical protein
VRDWLLRIVGVGAAAAGGPALGLFQHLTSSAENFFFTNAKAKKAKIFFYIFFSPFHYSQENNATLPLKSQKLSHGQARNADRFKCVFITLAEPFFGGRQQKSGCLQFISLKNTFFETSKVCSIRFQV